jgi:LysR family hydrogen peroxide-inducible transcriptional activator
MASITQLEYIIAVADYRHFGKAAKACHISQPTLSQQIQKVEELCEITIFDRIKKPVVPTLEGEAFLKQARVIVREHKRLLEMSRQNQNAPVGDFRLAIIPTVAPSLIPLFIGQFSEKFPKINLYIDELKTENILEELRHDRLDAAIMATPLGQTGFIEDPLYYENFLLYLSSNHPLSKKTVISESDLDGSEMWLLQDGNCFKDQVVKFCSIKQNDFSILKNIHFRSGNLDTLRAVVRHGSGYTMIPSLMAMNLSHKEMGEQVRTFRTPVPAREISLVYRRDYWKQHLVSALKQTILDCLPSQVALQKSKKIQVLEAC